MPGTALTKEERQLRWALRVGGLLFAGEILLYLLPALIGGTQDDWVQLPFVASSAVKAGFLAGLCALAASDIRRFSRVVTLLVAGFVLWVIAGIAILIWADTSRTYELLGVNLSMTAIVWAGVGLETGLALLFGWLHRRAVRARYDLGYLSVGQFRTMEALAESLLPINGGGLTPERVAVNLDHYMQRFDARRKWVIKVALLGISLYPLLYFRLPLTLIAADERRPFLQRRFGDDVARRRVFGFRWLVQGMIRIAQQITYIGYYGDPASHEEVGYVPFSRRPRFAELETELRRPGSRLRALGPADVEGDTLETDVAIVGSGAAGALLAYRLAESGRAVLVLERGRHIDPSEFTEDEIDMFGKLYRDGALQLARDFRLQVLQGMCVGGTTVINNAVSIPPSGEVLGRWEQLGALNGALSPRDVLDGVETVRDLLDISRQPKEIFQPGARKFVKGIDLLGLEEQAKLFAPVQANISGCLGCGYCNIGCAYGRKLSALDTLLPWGQEQFGDRVRILAECTAEGIETSDARAEAIACKLSDGRALRVRARTVVIAAGAINSSYLLGRSGIGGALVGRGLSFNMGSPMTADFDEELRSYDGLQISHVFEPAGEPRWLMETWWNPVLSQAVAMPGWFEDHRRNMLRYAHMTATGVLVGTASNGKVEPALFGGPDVVFEPEEADLRELIAGLKLAGRIYLKAGARRVMPATFVYHEFREAADLERLDDIVTDNSDIQLGTGHPQGGNALNARSERGVVDPNGFRVHGFRNLHLCDASVFPTSVKVNPQLTTMALAECAAPRIAAASG
jgi:choline dehydrogenase-like flavoprotein